MSAASAPRPVSDWPEDPYPGSWPDHSYVVEPAGDADDEAHVLAVEVSAEVASGWAVRDGATSTCLDDWLVERGLVPLGERVAVLSFGSNRCPSKVARQGGPYVNLRARTDGLAAVWSHGARGDGQVVATLVAAEGRQDEFFVSWCSPDDVALLDVVEGRGARYDLVELEPGAVVLEDGSRPDPVVAYVGLRPHRWPVAGDDGHPVVLDALDQTGVAALRAADAAHWEPDDDGPFTPLG